MSPADVLDVPTLGWDDLTAAMRWQQGEHVALVGPTGAGKTTAALALTPLRSHVLMTSTKAHDDTLSGLRRQGWVTIKRWPPPYGANRVVVHAPLVRLDTDGPKVGRTISDALAGAYQDGRWCVVLDDLLALNTTCGLANITRNLLVNARSSLVSLIVGTQRPRWVPREVWTQATHLFVWRCTDRDDLRALSGLGTADTDTVRAVVPTLQWGESTGTYELLYINTRTGQLARTTAPPPPR